jgi:hypothetical protein
MENVNLEMINERLIELANAVKSIQIQIGLSSKNVVSGDFGGFESQEELDAWNQASEETFKNFVDKYE